jgi:hypothetical protein
VFEDISTGSSVIYECGGGYKLACYVAVGIGGNPENKEQEFLEVHLLCRGGHDGESTHDLDDFLGGVYALRWDKSGTGTGGSGELQCTRGGVKVNTTKPRGHKPCYEWLTPEQLLEVNFNMNINGRIPDKIAKSVRAKILAKSGTAEVTPVTSDHAAASDATPSVVVSGRAKQPMRLEN